VSRYFATGLGGFVGRSIIQGLQSRGSLIALDRSGRLAERHGLRVVRGELEQPETYRHALSGVDTVVHLAAATGKASAGDHHRINVIGTETLVEACLTTGVRRLMFVSTIAVKFPDKRGYPYAQSKTDAERIVRQSELDFVIVRPTIVAGTGSPVMAGLCRLASLPLLPLFGGARARIQPIHVEDLAGLMLSVLDEDRFAGDVLEFGGPEVITIGKLLRELRLRVKGRAGPALTIPLMPLLPMLRVLETIVGPGPLPVTAGQLSSFRFDGTIEPNRYHEQRRGSMHGIADIVAEAVPR